MGAATISKRILGVITGLGIARQFILLVVGLAAALNLVVFGVIWQLATFANDMQKTSLSFTARTVAAGVDAELSKYKVLAELLAQEPLLLGDNLDAFEAEAREHFKLIDDAYLLISDVEGRPIASTMSISAAHIPRRSTEALQIEQRAFQMRSTIVSDVLLSLSAKEWVININVPVFKDGKPFRDLTLAVRVEKLLELLIAQKTPINWFAAIMDRQGNIVARVPNHDRFVGRPASPGWRDSKDRDGVFEIDALEGDPITIANAHTALNGWTVGIANKKAEFRAATWSAIGWSATVGGSLSILSVFLAALVTRRITRPISQLRDKAGRLLAGVEEAFHPASPEISEVWETIRLAFAERNRMEDERATLLATLDLSSTLVRKVSGDISFWSEGCERLYGWSASEAMGQRTHSFLQTVFPAPFPQIEETLLREGEWNGDVTQTRRDGAEIVVAVRKALKRTEAGEPAAVMESMANVTALRQTEAALRKLNAELEQRVREEVQTRETAQARLIQNEKLSALGQLAGGVAHDFNNIIQAVAGAAALIGRHAGDPEKVRRFSTMMEESAARGASVVRRLLSFARRGELRAETIHVLSLLEGVREVLSHTMGGSVDVRIDVPAPVAPAYVDRSQLEIVLVNLAINARDAMHGDGAIVISARTETVTATSPCFGRMEPGAYVRIEFTDTGDGMDAITLSRAMEPFFTTKEKGKGTGLGLPMARGFAEQSGGSLDIASELGRGTKVTLWLPVSSEEAAAPRPDNDNAELAAAKRNFRLLLVDDDEPVRQVLASELSDCGHTVYALDSGSAALTLLDADEHVDAIISDFSMPGMNGLALIQAAQKRRPNLPAILLTGYAAEAEALDEAHAARGTFTLLRKPISGAKLAECVVISVVSVGEFAAGN